ncbi:MAG: hypothetical protein PHI40_05880 [Caldisericia bacterium]|nr:hypothetical protein [Caldisericia bacterium]
MKYVGDIIQVVVAAIVIFVGIRKAKEKAEKNSWGGEPESIFEIIKTKVEPSRYPRVKIELRGEGHYVYVRNTGDGTAKNVILYSKYLEPMDSDTDENGLFIRPGEEITFFATSFDTKKINRVTISWRDHTGLHKQTVPVKQRVS